MKKLILLLLFIPLVSCNNSTKEKQKEEENKKEEMYYINTQGGLNVRDKPGADGKKIATLLMNDLVYFLEKTEISLTLNDFNELTGETREISGNWVKIKSQSPPKLKGDKILWEDNTENIEGYVFGCFLNKLETSVNDHLQAKFYNNEQLSYLKLLQGLWIITDPGNYCDIYGAGEKYFESIEPNFVNKDYNFGDGYYKSGKWYVYGYGMRTSVDLIELVDETSNGGKVFKIKGITAFEGDIFEEEKLLAIDENKQLNVLNTYSGDVSIYDQCRRNKTSNMMEVLKDGNWVQADKYQSFTISGSFAGTQDPYYLKDKYGDDLIIGGRRVPVPSVKHKFLFQDDDIVSLEQITSDGTRVYYDGKYQIIKNDDKIALIECKLSNGDGSNPTIIIEYSKSNESGKVKKDGVGGPEFNIYSVSNERSETQAYYDDETESYETPSKISSSSSPNGTYTYASGNLQFTIIVYGDRWSGTTKICSYCDVEYDSGIVVGNDVYDSTGYVKIGYISSNSLTTTFGGQRVTLRK